MAGVTWTARDWLNLFASVSTSFETPTFAQLGDPQGSPGINQAVDAQTSTNYEVGAKGLAGGRLQYSASIFSIDLEDQLVPFEVADDIFYRNAGESRREGFELALDYRFDDRWSTALAYTLNDFEFEDFSAAGVVLDGNDNPGVPENQLYAELSWTHPRGWYAIGDVLHVGSFYADDLNSAPARVDDYQVATLRGGRRLDLGGVSVNAFVGINNLLDEDYYANVRINQTFERFFEPAPGRHYYGGVAVRF